MDPIFKAVLIFMTFLSLANAEAKVDLNEFMPTTVEDASVVERGKFELQLSGRNEEADESLSWRPNLRWGAYKRVQVEIYSQHVSAPKRREKNDGQTNVGFQWNFNDQDNWVPAFALEPFIKLPTGKDSDGYDPSVRLNMSSTFAGTSDMPLAQLHLNARFDHNSSRQPDERKAGGLLVIGYSHLLWDKNVFILDFAHEKDIYQIDTSNILELGWIYEIKSSLKLGLSAGLDLREGYGVSHLSIQHEF